MVNGTLNVSNIFDPHSTSFVPKEFVNLTLNKSKVSIYPKLTESMSLGERGFEYFTTKDALEMADISISSRLPVFVQYMDVYPIVNGIMQRYHEFARKFIITKGNFGVVSYHRANGVVEMDSIPDQTGYLKPTSEKDLANCHPSGIVYAKLSRFIDFFGIYSPQTDTYPITYFVKLPQHAQIVQNKKGGDDGSLITFYVLNNWVEDADEDFFSPVCGLILRQWSPLLF